MVCTEYQERINELALAKFGASFGATRSGATPAANGGTESDASLAQHLAACAGCRAELDQRRALLARIDSGVAAMVAVEPSPSLAVLVRQQIAEESTASRSFAQRWGWWIGAAASAAAIAAIVLASALHGPTHPPTPSANIAPQAPQNSSASVIEGPTIPVQPGNLPTILQNTQQNRPRIATARNSEIGPPQFEVVVPPGQREAIIRLAAGLQSGRVDGSVLLNPPVPVETRFLEITPLEIKPLVGDTDSDSDSDGSQKSNSAVRNWK